jgi:hypothetical protein
VPQPQESELDVPREASHKEEPFEIELVVPESPTAQDSPAEEQQQPKDQDMEDKTNEAVEAPVLTDRLWALLEHLGITTAPRYKIKEVPHSGRVEFKAITKIFFGSKVH